MATFTIPNFLVKILEFLHLKDSEVTKLKKRIAKCDKGIQALNKEIEKHVEEIRLMERDFMSLKQQYDVSKGSIQETYAVRLRNILKQRERTSEFRQVIQQQLNAKLLLRHNLVLQLEHLQYFNEADLEDMQEEKLDLIDDMKRQSRTIEQLENTTLDIDGDNAGDVFKQDDGFKEITMDDIQIKKPKETEKEDEA